MRDPTPQVVFTGMKYFFFWDAVVRVRMYTLYT